jgi:hypothetical protein
MATTTGKHPFLSPAWIAAARVIRDRHAGKVPTDLPAAMSVKMNVVVVSTPFGEDPVDAHVDTSSGALTLDLGHVEGPDVTITLDYDTARQLFVEQNVQLVMQAFLNGRIRVQGDMSKLLSLQAGAAQFQGRVDPASALATAKQVAGELSSITSD